MSIENTWRYSNAFVWSEYGIEVKWIKHIVGLDARLALRRDNTSLETYSNLLLIQISRNNLFGYYYRNQHRIVFALYFEEVFQNYPVNADIGILSFVGLFESSINK